MAYARTCPSRLQIALHRACRGDTFAEIAAKTGFHRESVRRYLSEEKAPVPFAFVVKLAQTYEFSLDELAFNKAFAARLRAVPMPPDLSEATLDDLLCEVRRRITQYPELMPDILAAAKPQHNGKHRLRLSDAVGS